MCGDSATVADRKLQDHATHATQPRSTFTRLELVEKLATYRQECQTLPPYMAVRALVDCVMTGTAGNTERLAYAYRKVE